LDFLNENPENALNVKKQSSYKLDTRKRRNKSTRVLIKELIWTNDLFFIVIELRYRRFKCNKFIFNFIYEPYRLELGYVIY